MTGYLFFCIGWQFGSMLKNCLYVKKNDKKQGGWDFPFWNEK